MKRLTEEQIKELNNRTDSDQGIYIQPMGVPNEIKTHVIYLTWEKRGEFGANCWDNKQTYFENEEPPFEILSYALEIILPNLTGLQYSQILRMIKDNENEECDYYGNWTNHGVKYIILEELYEFLGI